MEEPAVPPEFSNWLSKKLISLDIDDDVYGSYIISILNDEEDRDFIPELLKETLGSILDENVDELCEEILKSWNESSNQKIEEELTTIENNNNLNEMLATHLTLVSKQDGFKKTEKPICEEQESLKKSVMALYNSMQSTEQIDGKADLENDDDDSTLFCNTNAQSVSNAEKEDRAKRKEESIRKKEKDKMDLELQKLKKIERKEKEKKRTQKRDRVK